MAIAPQRLFLLALGFALAAASGDGKRRGLLQATVRRPTLLTDSSLYSPLQDGGLALISNVTILSGETSGGDRAYTSPINTNKRGYTTVLELSDVVTASRIWANVGCLTLSLETDSERVSTFLTTWANFEALADEETLTFDIDAATAIGDSNLTTSNPGPNTVSVNPNEYYLFVLYSDDPGNVTATYDIVGHPSGSDACSNAARRGSTRNPGAASSPIAPSPAARPVAAPPPAVRPSLRGRRRLQQTPGSFPSSSSPSPSRSLVNSARIAKALSFSHSQFGTPFVVQDASCLAYQLLGYSPQFLARSRVDVLVFVLNETAMLHWADVDFRLQDADFLASIQAVCAQNDSVASACGAYVDDLVPGVNYWVTILTGAQQPEFVSDDVTVQLALTAQSTGSCRENSIQNWNDSIVDPDLAFPAVGGRLSTPPPPYGGGAASPAAAPDAAPAGAPASSPDSLLPLPG